MRLVTSVLMLATLFVSACSSPTPVPLPEVQSSPIPQSSPAAQSSPIPQPSSTVEPSPAGYPLDTRTGIVEIDTILAAVASGNAEELRALVAYTTAPCTTADGLGGPPKCLEGEAEGTQVEVLPFLGPEGGFFRKSEIGNWTGVDADEMYAVYRISESALNEQYYLPGEYIIFFMPQENQTATALRVGNGGIVRVDTFFGEFPDSVEIVIERDTSEVILPPRTR